MEESQAAKDEWVRCLLIGKLSKYEGPIAKNLSCSVGEDEISHLQMMVV